MWLMIQSSAMEEEELLLLVVVGWSREVPSPLRFPVDGAGTPPSGIVLGSSSSPASRDRPLTPLSEVLGFPSAGEVSAWGGLGGWLYVESLSVGVASLGERKP